MPLQKIPFTTPYDSAPFAQISTADFAPAFEKAIAETQHEIDTITANTSLPTFENTIEALAYSGSYLDRISNLFFNLNAAETNDALQKMAQEIAPKLSALSNDITLNTKLFQRVETVFGQKNNLQLNTEQNTLLEKTYKSFVRNGALLSSTQKERLRSIDAELAVSSLKFGENVLADTQAYTLHLTHENQLEGLPEDTIEAAQHLAEKEGKEGWIFTLDFPSYLPFVTYAKNRNLRKEISIAAGKKGFQDNAHNNSALVFNIVALRQERAQLLGYSSYAAFVLEERMAQTPEKVHDFLQELLAKAKPAAQKEFEELSAFAQELDGLTHLEKWDVNYYTEKLKQKKFNLDDEKLKPYFKLEQVLHGAFEVANRLYGLHFEEVHDVQKYHEEVQTFVVTDAEGNYKALLYTDFFPRKGKRNGAWMTSFKPQYIKNGVNERPHISIVCNFTKPTPTKPSLLTFVEVTTLFHEFGHALHGILANTQYPTLSGTSVFWDFVELPSQIMENWCYEPEALALFAKHYKTQETLPQDYVEKIKESAQFMEGMATLRQLSFGLLDMGWHSIQEPIEMDIKAFENKQFGDTQLYPDVAENTMSTAFSHIFQGGYAAGYYSYKWAEVLDADAFSHFKESGIFNRTTGKKFEDMILSRGGSDHPMTLYKNFRGKEPQPEALLKRAGLL